MNNSTTASSPDKRLPITFVLDTSGSMLFDAGDGRRTKIDVMNEIVEKFIVDCCGHHDRAPRLADVGFILFNDHVILDLDYAGITRLNTVRFPSVTDSALGPVNWIRRINDDGTIYDVPKFSICENDVGTNIGKAVLYAVDKIMNQIAEKGSGNIYPPFLVLITDGHPMGPGQHQDQAAKQAAIQALHSHCETHGKNCNLIIPLVIPVGKLSAAETHNLWDYIRHFDAGYLPYNHNDPEKSLQQWELVTRLLAYSLAGSTDLMTLAFINGEEKARKDFYG